MFTTLLRISSFFTLFFVTTKSRFEIKNVTLQINRFTQKFLTIMSAIRTSLLIVLFSLATISALAQKNVYGFAYATSLKDSVVYLSAIQTLPEAQIGKHGFLNYRADYGNQFCKYIQQYYALPYVTTVIYFDTKRSKLEKQYLKAKRRVKYDQQKQTVEIPYSDFRFEQIQ